MENNQHSLADTYNLRQQATSEDEKLDQLPDNYLAYRLDRQMRPSIALLDFWFANGNQRALAYNHLYDVEFNPSEGLKLTFSEHVVTIKGHQLDELYRGLKRHRAVFVWEADLQSARLAKEDAAVVSKISIELRHEPA